jgi:Flp pilus assembly pilin Flp
MDIFALWLLIRVIEHCHSVRLEKCGFLWYNVFQVGWNVLAPWRRQNIMSVRCFLRNERGQGLTEYAMIMGLVAIVCVAAVSLFSETIQDTFYSVIGDTVAGL